MLTGDPLESPPEISVDPSAMPPSSDFADRDSPMTDREFVSLALVPIFA
jgi:hypothetical protein